jgi:hypothetical protein
MVAAAADRRCMASMARERCTNPVAWQFDISECDPISPLIDAAICAFGVCDKHVGNPDVRCPFTGTRLWQRVPPQQESPQ